MAPDDIFFAYQRALAGRHPFERELGRGGTGIVCLAPGAAPSAMERTPA